MNLSGKASFRTIGQPFLGIVESVSINRMLSVRNLSSPELAFLAVSVGKDGNPECDVSLSDHFDYLGQGDIIRFNPQAGVAGVLYRRNSRHNFLFFTERCNSRCLMCSQPPRDVDDRYLVEDILASIPWMSTETIELGITGGEPTLLHEKLLEVIATAKFHLPATALHMLSNGRLFSYPRYAQKIAELKHPNFMVGIPLYADNAAQHDFVVQSVGAFDQTVLGLLNLARFGVRIELRIVIHRFTHERLPQFAHYVIRNLPFVEQVSLMGLELMGYARSNLDALWIDPADYQAELTEAVAILEAGGVRPLIFNHQLCVLRDELHPYAAKSISDWKNTYLPTCAECELRNDCGGFFASSALRYSEHIHPIKSHTTV